MFAMHHPKQLRKLAVSGANFRQDGLSPAAAKWLRDTPIAKWPPESQRACELVAPDPGHWDAFAEKWLDFYLGAPDWTTEQLLCGADAPAPLTAKRRAAIPCREPVSIYPHLERGRGSPSNASRIRCAVRGTLLSRRHQAIYSTEGIFKCLRRILLCAWTTRQRMCFLTRRATRSPSSRETSVRCRAVRAPLSRTGSSSFAIKDSGTSAFVDLSTIKLRHRSHPRRCAAAISPASAQPALLLASAPQQSAEEKSSATETFTTHCTAATYISRVR